MVFESFFDFGVIIEKLCWWWRCGGSDELMTPKMEMKGQASSDSQYRTYRFSIVFRYKFQKALEVVEGQTEMEKWYGDGGSNNTQIRRWWSQTVNERPRCAKWWWWWRWCQRETIFKLDIIFRPFFRRRGGGGSRDEWKYGIWRDASSWRTMVEWKGLNDATNEEMQQLQVSGGGGVADENVRGGNGC